MPGGLVALVDVVSGAQHLAQVGSAIGGKAGGAQRLEREGLVIEQELHGRLVPAASRCPPSEMAPPARKPSISPPVNPSCFSTSSLCSPRSGARRAGTFFTSRICSGLLTVNFRCSPPPSSGT